MKLDENTVGEMLLEAEADRVESERQLNAAVQAAIANGQETARLFEQFKAEARIRDAEAARLVEELRADLSHERAEAQSISELKTGLEDIRKLQEQGTTRLQAMSKALLAERVRPQAPVPQPTQNKEPQTVRVIVREKDGNGDIAVADVKIGYDQ